MKPANEKQLLLAVLKQLDRPDKKINARSSLSNVVLWLVSATVFFLIFRYGGPLGWTDLILGVVCFSFGMFFAFDLYRTMHAEQWPVITSYLDRSRVEARLHEFGA